MEVLSLLQAPTCLFLLAFKGKNQYFTRLPRLTFFKILPHVVFKFFRLKTT